MCLIAVALNAHPHFQLVLAANRDEFHDRPTAPAQYWDATERVFGGRDLRQGGSWLAVRRDGRWAAVTNVRRMEPPAADAPSRGALVSDFVSGTPETADYLDDLRTRADRFPGFNLLLGDGMHAHYASNRPDDFQSQSLAAGVHAVSNAALDTPWPKLRRLREVLSQWCATEQLDIGPLFDALADEQLPPNSELPDTGVGADLERFLAPTFIRGERYGTRASSVVLMEPDGRLHFIERRFGANGEPLGESREILMPGQDAAA